ncbi:MAG: hypothetical protein ACRC41_09725 [Sarcina sp.]
MIIQDIDINLEAGESKDLKGIFRALSQAFDINEEYFLSRFSGLTKEEIINKKGYITVDYEDDTVGVEFNIINFDEYNQLNTKVEIIRIW